MEPAAEPKSPEALMEELREILASNAAGNVELLNRVVNLLSSSARHTPIQTHAPDTSRLVAQGLEAILASSAIINNHSLAMLNELLTVAEQTLGTSVEERQTQGATSDVDEPADLHIEGRVGEQAAGDFVVDNEYDSPVQVRFAMGTSGIANTVTLPREYVKLSPVSAVIPANGSTTVRVTVDVANELIVGQTYGTTIQVTGFEAPEVKLHLKVLPTRPSGGKPHTGTKAAKRGKGSKGRSP